MMASKDITPPSSTTQRSSGCGGASARSVFLVHGEEKSAAALMEALTADGLHAPVSFPDRGTVFDTADLA